MKLIDKDKVVAEIKGRLSLLEGGTGHPDVMKRVEGVINGYKSILTFLDTLETKEGDLEKEIEDILNQYYFFPEEAIDTPTIIRITAHHFFELGLKTQKGE